MRLLWTPESVVDRQAIYDYIEADNPLAAIELDESFEGKSQVLTQHPNMDRSGRVPKTRELVVHPNHLLIYRVSGQEIHILRVMHAARQWPDKPNVSKSRQREPSGIKNLDAQLVKWQREDRRR
jgi:toxin ParE1/3/4